MKIKLVEEPPRMSKRQIIAELRGELKVYLESYREADNVVRNMGAIRTIGALRQVIEFVQGKRVK